MRLHLLGTTGYHPNQHRHTACLMIPEIGVILDAGTGMFRARKLLTTDELDIFVTHAHLDHVIGITFLFDILWESSVKRTRVLGEAKKLAAIEKHLFAPELFPALPPFEFQSLPDSMPLRGGGKISHFPLEHPGGSIGFRLDWPTHSLAYVTDTTASADAPYVEKIRGVDLLIHECYFPDGWETLATKTGHSCTTPVAEVARAANVQRLLLIHMNPLSEQDDADQLAAARRIFPNTDYAVDEMVIDL